ncbi:hypothetical protein LTR93_011613 [Exophiala xenobiotica]|nr:hypothetical protein LTR93_011613 [Exophiala xenobiotica]
MHGLDRRAGQSRRVRKGAVRALLRPSVLLSSIDDERSDNLSKNVADIILAKHGTSEALYEWRASCVRTARMMTAEPDRRYPKQMAYLVRKHLGQYGYHSSGSSQRKMVLADLGDLCQRAYVISLLLRETKIEYQ